MNTEYHRSLVSVSARLDQLLAEADAILAGTGDMEIGDMAEELRELVVTMQSLVESKLERGE
jgi:hypothetical protein